MRNGLRLIVRPAASLLGSPGIARAGAMTPAEAFGTPFCAAIAVPGCLSYAPNEQGTPAAEVAAWLKGFGAVVPDLDWKVIDVIPADGRIIARGEATGTPVAPLFGIRRRATRSGSCPSTYGRWRTASPSRSTMSRIGQRASGSARAAESVRSGQNVLPA